MTDNSIGLHVYSLKLRKKRKFNNISLSPTGDGSALIKCIPSFLQHHTAPIDPNTGRPRTWYFDTIQKDGFSFCGTIHYGSSGFESEIVDGRTRKLQYKRSVTDLDIIPIYYRIWVPESGKFGILALQTFGQRSCVGRIQHALQRAIRAPGNSVMLDINPVHPATLGSYLSADVKTISLVKREYSSDAAENAIISPNDIIDLDVSIKAKPRSNLGKLSELMAKIKGKGDEDRQIVFNNTEFKEASASVVVGGKTRKVTLIGLSKNTGKIDLSETISREVSGHPKFDSIDGEVKKIILDFVAG